MRSKPKLVLPVVLAFVAGAVWICYSSLGPGAVGGGILGDADGVLASSESGALPAPGVDPESGEATGSSERVEIEMEPLVDPEEAAAAEVPEREGTRLRGTVVRAAGVTVEGASVQLRRTPRWISLPADVETVESFGMQHAVQEVATDEEGRFVLYDVEPGKYALSIRSAGLAPLRRTDVEVPEHEDYDLGRFELELGVRVAGKVVGLRGRGLEGVRVLGAVGPQSGFTRLELPGHGIPLTTTDAEGRFEVDCLAPGPWHLVFDDPGHRVAEKTGRTEPAGNSERGLLIQLDPGLGIEGRVVGLDAAEKDPLRVTARFDDEQPSGAADEIQGAERHRARHAEVAADGSFALPGLAPGVQYKLCLYRREAPAEAGEETAEPGRWRKVRGVEEVSEIAGARKVELKYREAAVVVVRPRSAEDGRALERFHMSVSGQRMGGGGLLLDEEGEPRGEFPGGEARFEDLLPAENGTDVTVRLRAEGYQDFQKEGLLLRPGDELDLGEIELEPAPTGVVRVVDEESGEPIAGARVVFARAADENLLAHWADLERDRPLADEKVRSTLTDAKGQARLSLWEGSVCVARAGAEGYRGGEPGRLVPPYDDTVELELVRGGRITVRVVDGRGNPVPGMYVEHEVDGKNSNHRHRWDPEARQENKTDEAGEVVFENLPKGKHDFNVLERLNPWGGGGESAGFEAKGDVYLDEGESEELELRVEARGGLVVSVLESGMPLVGALVKVSPVDDDSADRGWWWTGGQEDPRSKISDHTGLVKFAGIKVGRYHLKVSHADRRMVVRREVMISTDVDHMTVDVGLCVIEGRVTDPEGDPLKNISMVVYAKDQQDRWAAMNDYRVRIVEDEDGDADWDVDQVKQWSIQTDGEGRYALRGVAPECLLVVQASHQYVVGDSREVGPLGSEEYLTPFDFALERAGALRVDLPGTDRKERGKLRLKLTRIEGEGEEAEEKEERNVRMRSWRTYTTISSLRPGRWRIDLTRQDQTEPLVQREVTIRVNETERQTIQL